MSAVREIVSGGGSTQQLRDEMATLTEDERQELLSSKCTANITPDMALAMKADLILPWRKLRIMRR